MSLRALWVGKKKEKTRISASPGKYEKISRKMKEIAQKWGFGLFIVFRLLFSYFPGEAEIRVFPLFLSLLFGIPVLAGGQGPEIRVVRGPLGTDSPDPTLESASPSSPQGLIWHRNTLIFLSLPFLNSLLFPFQEIPCFFQRFPVFPFFPRDFMGSLRINDPCFSWSFEAIFCLKNYILSEVIFKDPPKCPLKQA